MNSQSFVVRAARALVVFGALSAGLLVATGASADLPKQIKLPPLLTCEQQLDGIVAELGKPGNNPFVLAPTSLVLNDEAYGSKHASTANRISKVGTKLAGTVSVGEPGIPPAPGSFGATPISKTVAVEIFKAADGKATMKWVVDGATYQSTVDSCQSRNFTASAARSAIIVHLNPATTVTN